MVMVSVRVGHFCSGRPSAIRTNTSASLPSATTTDAISCDLLISIHLGSFFMSTFSGLGASPLKEIDPLIAPIPPAAGGGSTGGGGSTAGGGGGGAVLVGGGGVSVFSAGHPR